MSSMLNIFRIVVLLFSSFGISMPIVADQLDINKQFERELITELYKKELSKRRFVAELIAVTVAIQLDFDQSDHISQILRNSVDNQVNVLSAAVRKPNGEVVSQTELHLDHWQLMPHDRSTSTQVQLPLYEDGANIMMVEIRFRKIDLSTILTSQENYAELLAANILPSFLSEPIFIKRILQYTAQNRYVKSAAVRSPDGDLIASSRNHRKEWQAGGNTLSNNRYSTPIYRTREHIATVEVTVASL